MTNPASSPWPLPDRRRSEQIERDRAAVRAQIEALSRRAGTTMNRIVRRASRNGDGTGIDVLPQPSGSVLTKQNELVVEATEEQLGQADLAGYVETRREGCRTQVFRCPGKNYEQLQAEAERLRDMNIKASFNLIVPLGYVVKADAFPGRTEAPGDFPSTSIDQSVRVAIIDTGRTAENRSDGWFTGVVAEDTDPLNEVAPMDRNDYFSGHGSFTAGVVRQVAPRCEVMVYRFTGADGVGTDAAAADMLIKAAEEAGNRRLIINASFGAPAVDGIPPLALQEAVGRIAAEHPDVLIVASAGNDGSTEPFYPAGFDEFGVKAVGALNADLSEAAFSNRGDWVECSTVGVGVVSTFVEGKLPPEPGLAPTDVNFPANAWATWSGTSFTAPQISGAVAHLCTQTPGLAPKDAFDQLIAGRPTLDGFGAVVHLLPGTPLT